MQKSIFLEKLLFYIMAVTAFIFPLFPYLIRYCYPAILGLILITYGFREIVKLNKWQLFLIFFPVIFYLLHLVRLIGSVNNSEGCFDLEVKLSLITIPVFACINTEFVRRIFEKIGLAFVAGNIIASLYCLGIAIINSTFMVNGRLMFNPYLPPYNVHYLNYFTYTYFCRLMHPSYFSMYVIFSIIILCYIISKKHLTRTKILISIGILFLMVILLLINSKAGILIAITYILIISIQKLIELKLFIHLTSIILIALIGLVFLFKTDARFNKLVFNITNARNSNELESSGERILIWESTIKIIKTNVWFGVGPGDIKDKLVAEYKKYPNMEKTWLARMNPHNQFLETFATLGVFGLILLLLIFLLPLYFVRADERFILLSFVFITFLNFIFESMLNRESGVLFFVFFYSLILLNQFYNDCSSVKNNLNLH